MEKKSTRIAYFVALGIFIVLLVILGISYKDAPILIEDATTPFAGTFWSLLPPIVAIVLALIEQGSVFLSVPGLPGRRSAGQQLQALGDAGAAGGRR